MVLHFIQAIYLAMLWSIFVKIGKIMASLYFLVLCSSPSNKDASNWDLITKYSFFRLF